MLWFEFSRSAYLKRHADMVLLTSFVGFAWFWHFFNIRGGFAHNPSYPSPSALWIVLPTIEGAAYGCIIASYEHAKFALSGPLGRAVALAGMVSYSVYLWHFTAIAQLAPLFPKPEGFAQSSIAAVATFPLMVGLGYLSYRLIEMPFFRFRVPYLGSGSIKAHRMPR
jgi:peptidoglycan/LPS O-acetylase OafA/YrhL